MVSSLIFLARSYFSSPLNSHNSRTPFISAEGKNPIELNIENSALVNKACWINELASKSFILSTTTGVEPGIEIRSIINMLCDLGQKT